ncbi:type II secretion system F family protein [Peptococcus simiae]|uniref:Type II secretion system F family protein n=1 Tax=Peptococcus simiae TaxID=1643805 RepID=A0ABW9GZ26_9FIRM
MKIFKYTAMRLDGQVQEGEKAAASVTALADLLQAEGYYLLREEPLSLIDRAKRWLLIDEEALIFLLRQLAFMLKSGIPMTRALTYLEKDAPKRYSKIICQDLLRGLGKGLPIQLAWRNSALNLPPEVGDWLEIGDLTGDLSHALVAAADELAERRRFRKNLQQQLFYPALVLLLLVLFFNLLIFLILPTLARTYDQLGVALPLALKPLAGLNHLFTSPGPALALALSLPLVLLAGGLWLLHQPEARKWGQGLLRQVPGLNRLLAWRLYISFAGGLGRLLQAGVGLERGLYFLSKRQHLRPIEEGIGQVVKDLYSGQPLSRAVGQLDFVPDLAGTLLYAGEQAGNLPDALLQTADYYRDRLDIEQRFLMRIIEPVAVVLLGAMVLAVALLFFLPLLGTYDRFLG